MLDFFSWPIRSPTGVASSFDQRRWQCTFFACELEYHKSGVRAHAFQERSGLDRLGIKSFVHDATTLILGSSRRFRVGQQRTNNSAVESPSLLGTTPLLTRLQKQTCACDSSKHLMERLSLCIMVGLRTTLNDRSRIPVCSLCAEIPQESRLSLYEFEILACLEFIFVPETHTDRLIGTTGAK